MSHPYMTGKIFDIFNFFYFEVQYMKVKCSELTGSNNSPNNRS